MDNSKRIGNYLKSINYYQLQEVVVGDHLFQFQRSTTDQIKSVTISSGTNIDNIYIADATTFNAFLDHNCLINDISTEINQFIAPAEKVETTQLVAGKPIERNKGINIFEVNEVEEEQETEESPAESLLNENKEDILKAVKDFFAEPNKTIDLEQLIEPAPFFEFTKEKED